jgi:transcriptional regulator NrdR family protein
MVAAKKITVFENPDIGLLKLVVKGSIVRKELSVEDIIRPLLQSNQRNTVAGEELKRMVAGITGKCR